MDSRLRGKDNQFTVCHPRTVPAGIYSDFSELNNLFASCCFPDYQPLFNPFLCEKLLDFHNHNQRYSILGVYRPKHLKWVDQKGQRLTSLPQINLLLRMMLFYSYMPVEELAHPPPGRQLPIWRLPAPSGPHQAVQMLFQPVWSSSHSPVSDSHPPAPAISWHQP